MLILENNLKQNLSKHYAILVKWFLKFINNNLLLIVQIQISTDGI